MGRWTATTTTLRSLLYVGTVRSIVSACSLQFHVVHATAHSRLRTTYTGRGYVICNKFDYVLWYLREEREGFDWKYETRDDQRRQAAASAAVRTYTSTL